MARLIENVLLQIVQNELMCQHVFLGVEREVYGGWGDNILNLSFTLFHDKHEYGYSIKNNSAFVQFKTYS